MRLRAFLLLLLFIAVILPLPTHGDSDDCTTILPSRVAVGFIARVTFDNTVPVMLRENPGDDYRQNAALREGTVMRIMGGPTCSDDMEWWQVRTLDGQGGWISEGDEAAYWIEPWPISMDIVRSTAKSFALMRVDAASGAVREIGSFPAAAQSDEPPTVQPSPDGKLLLLLEQRRVSIESATSQTTILDIPANATATSYNRIDGAWWSPDSTRILLLAEYGTADRKLLVYDRQSAGLFDLGDGLNPAWDELGQRVQWFSVSSSQPGAAPEVLVSANYDGTDETSMALPSGIDFMSEALPWNEAGTRVLGCTQRGTHGCVVVAAFDVSDQRVVGTAALDPAVQAAGYQLVKWLSDTQVIWLPVGETVSTVYVQNIAAGTNQMLHLKATGSTPFTIADATPFVDGSSLLVTLRDARGTLDTLIVRADSGQITPVKMPEQTE